MLGVSVKTISQATGIDRWFLYEIQKICVAEKEIRKYKLDTLPLELLREAKTLGFSDAQIATIMQDGNEEAVFQKRSAAGIHRIFKMVDTCSAEFEAKTPYFYSTFENGGTNESLVSKKKKSLFWDLVRTASGRESNSTIVVYTVC